MSVLFSSSMAFNPETCLQFIPQGSFYGFWPFCYPLLANKHILPAPAIHPNHTGTALADSVSFCDRKPLETVGVRAT